MCFHQGENTPRVVWQQHGHHYSLQHVGIGSVRQLGRPRPIGPALVARACTCAVARNVEAHLCSSEREAARADGSADDRGGVPYLGLLDIHHHVRFQVSNTDADDLDKRLFQHRCDRWRRWELCLRVPLANELYREQHLPLTTADDRSREACTRGHVELRANDRWTYRVHVLVVPVNKLLSRQLKPGWGGEVFDIVHLPATTAPGVSKGGPRPATCCRLSPCRVGA